MKWRREPLNLANFLSVTQCPSLSRGGSARHLAPPFNLHFPGFQDFLGATLAPDHRGRQPGEYRLINTQVMGVNEGENRGYSFYLLTPRVMALRILES